MTLPKNPARPRVSAANSGGGRTPHERRQRKPQGHRDATMILVRDSRIFGASDLRCPLCPQKRTFRGAMAVPFSFVAFIRAVVPLCVAAAGNRNLLANLNMLIDPQRLFIAIQLIF